ncbi:MAG: hypothetical protein NC394_03615 [Bacteroides sp.]|nr:hypothetical protein [Bacteroides sp.]
MESTRQTAEYCVVDLRLEAGREKAEELCGEQLEILFYKENTAAVFHRTEKFSEKNSEPSEESSEHRRAVA